jgi:hypothetical protein
MIFAIAAPRATAATVAILKALVTPFPIAFEIFPAARPMGRIAVSADLANRDTLDVMRAMGAVIRSMALKIVFMTRSSAISLLPRFGRFSQFTAQAIVEKLNLSLGQRTKVNAKIVRSQDVHKHL